MTGIIIPSEFESKVIKFPHHVSNMGKINAACAVYDLVAKGFDRILLTGFCGGLDNVSIGEVIEPDTFIEGDYDVSPLEKYPNMIITPKVTGYTMISQDKFLKENRYSFSVNKCATDMESYAVAAVCLKLNVKFQVIKIVSDIVGNNSVDDFLDSCTKLAPKINDVIYEDLMR